MKTSALPPKSNDLLMPTSNYNGSSFLIAVACYVPFICLLFYSHNIITVSGTPPPPTSSIHVALEHFNPQPAMPQPPIETPQPPKPVEPPKPKPIPKEQPKPIEKVAQKPKPIKQEVKPEPKPTPQPPQEQVAQTQPQQPTTPSQPQTTAAPAPQSVASESNVKTPAPIQTLSYQKDSHPILKDIKKAIDANTQYPRKARRMGMEGIVLVEFLLHHSGKVEDIRLLQKSGHDILDDSAIETIKKASSSFPRPQENIRIQVPISYALR